MRFRAFVVFARLCGAAGLGVLLGAAAAGLLNIITGQAFIYDSAWLAGFPVLAVIGAAGGFAAAWLTRRWLAPAAARRRLLGAVIGAVALPLATALAQGEPIRAVAFPLVLIGAAGIVALWVRGYRRETAMARSVMYGRPATRA
ncbi:hypothetical protein LZ318_30765 [Saccharopolyspora indica]|uniref:hypothetical protein n=1 Tax=Saccharopolyspora indica TaxID=1229659 RepID=UPI0022EA756E|nr:hypothetical protein [Saccharopolyspora indica]MDA3644385.1 hypothetical protein [Saccharopolyspora indica]